jgi:hypothetical protein
MKCVCGGEYVYEDGVIYCNECFRVVYREKDPSIQELNDYMKFLIDTDFMSLYAIGKFLELSPYVAKRVYYKVKRKEDGSLYN